MQFVVTRVRKEKSSTGDHEHITHVCVDGSAYTVDQVVSSIYRGDKWFSQGGGVTIPIKALSNCFHNSRCPKKPYIKTDPDSSTKDNLEYLLPC